MAPVWTAPPLWDVTKAITAAKLNQLIGNDGANAGDLDYLFNGRPGQVILRDGNADYTTSSTTFVDVDATNLAITLTISSGKVEIFFSGAVPNGNLNTQVDVSIDGTRFGNGFADGITGGPGQFGGNNISFHVVKTGLSVGSHTFKLQFKWTTGGNLNAAIASGLASAGHDFVLVFGVVEIG